MARSHIGSLLALVAVAREGSFTKAAADMGVSQSALSHSISGLEAKMGVRLLARTTRSVTPTEAGLRLLQTVRPNFEEIEAELAAIGELRDKPSGTVRITALDFVTDTILWPRLAPLLLQYPDIRVEISANYRMVDIAAEGYDFGVRSGSQVARDMVALRISPDYRRVVVGSPAYFRRRPAPLTPEELAQHNCITMRLASSGGLFAWELKKGRRAWNLRPGGQLTFNNTRQIVAAALAGSGLAFTPEPLVREHIAARRLRPVLDDWAPSSPGFHLYYASQRQPSRAVALVVDALRYRP